MNLVGKDITAQKYLNDRGIKQAIEYGFLKIYPDLDFNDSTRIQPATLDVKIHEIDSSSELDNRSKLKHFRGTMVEARSYNEIGLTELILHDRKIKRLNVDFIFPFIEARSSVRRLGGFVPTQGRYFYSSNERSFVELNNYSHNNIIFEKGERFAQVFFKVDPFAHKWHGGYTLDNLKSMNFENPEELLRDLNETFEKVESLDYGIEIKTNEEIDWLLRKGYLEVSPKVKIKNGCLLVHASDEAHKIKKIDEPIYFSQRKKYVDKIHEKIKLKKGFVLNPKEHIDIITVESFKLSEHVGIHFYNNPLSKATTSWNNESISSNFELVSVADGWVDPGYEGPFSRQPKWFTPQVINPGDIVGYGKLIYYPNGVGSVYGSEKLGSQYNNAKANAISK